MPVLATDFLSALQASLLHASLPSEFSKSFLPSGLGPARCQRLPVIAGAGWRLPTGSLSSAEAPCWPVAAACPGGPPARPALRVLPQTPQPAASLAGEWA